MIAALKRKIESREKTVATTLKQAEARYKTVSTNLQSAEATEAKAASAVQRLEATVRAHSRRFDDAVAEDDSVAAGKAEQKLAEVRTKLDVAREQLAKEKSAVAGVRVAMTSAEAELNTAQREAEVERIWDEASNAKLAEATAPLLARYQEALDELDAAEDALDAAHLATHESGKQLNGYGVAWGTPCFGLLASVLSDKLAQDPTVAFRLREELANIRTAFSAHPSGDGGRSVGNLCKLSLRNVVRSIRDLKGRPGDPELAKALVEGFNAATKTARTDGDFFEALDAVGEAHRTAGRAPVQRAATLLP